MSLKNFEQNDNVFDINILYKIYKHEAVLAKHVVRLQSFEHIKYKKFKI